MLIVGPLKQLNGSFATMAGLRDVAGEGFAQWIQTVPHFHHAEYTYTIMPHDHQGRIRLEWDLDATLVSAYPRGEQSFYSTTRTVL